MSDRTFETFAYWDFPLGDGWLILVLAAGVVAFAQREISRRF